MTEKEVQRFEKLLAQMGEHLSHIRGDMGEMKITQVQILAHDKNVDDHLEKLNSKVATHVRDINELQKHNIEKDPKLEAVYADLALRDKEQKIKYKQWAERFMFIAVIIGIILMVRSGLIHPDLPDLITNIF